MSCPCVTGCAAPPRPRLSLRHQLLPHICVERLITFITFNSKYLRAFQMANSDLAATPAGNPPAGTVPNLEHPQSLARVFFSEGSILLFIMFVLLGVRIYAKTCVLRRASWDDCEDCVAIPLITPSLTSIPVTCGLAAVI